MPISMTLSYSVDLAQPLKKTLLSTAFLTGDSQAHCFDLALHSGNEIIDLSDASVTGYFIRADGATVILKGSVQNGHAQLSLSETCYHQPGRFNLVVRIIQGNVKTTVFWAEGAMTLSSTDTLVNDMLVPTLDDLLAQIDAMESATVAAQTVAATVQQKLDSGELTGRGLIILGYYDSEAALSAAVSSPAPGDAYAVGTAAPYNTYIWNGTSQSWVNNGPLQGVQGAKGDKGDKGDTGADGRDGIDAAANLLDNSDFTNPINQREQTTYSTSGQYTFDRWMLSAPSGGTVSVGNGYVAMYTEGDYVDIQQVLERASLMTGKAYTFAVMLNGASAPYLLNFTFGTAASASFMDGQVTLIHYNSDRVIIRVAAKQSWIGFTWAALYEGTYTADTLPNYAPKGYATELAECKRYFEKVTGGMFAAESNKSTLTCVRGYNPKRIAPTLSFSVGDSLLMNCPGVGETTVTVTSVDASADYFDHISVNESLTAGNVYVYNYIVSADL